VSILDRIVAAKRQEVQREMQETPLRRVIELATTAPPPRDFGKAVRREGQINIIAEVKRASPSRGPLQPGAEVETLARAYAEGGAAAISVLTERRFFLGAPGDLAAAKEAAAPPVLRKDFLVDEWQIYESRALGADAVLLIARLLPDWDLARLLGLARSLHMDALVEVHAEEEIARAVGAGADIVGVNNRDLATLAVSLETSIRLAERLPAGIVWVSESGIETHADVARLRAAGYGAFLVGERLMRESDPAGALRALLGVPA
jgi:indole-3-glycerol phosphate synthase